MNTSRILLTSLTLLSFAAACGGEEPTPTTTAPKITSSAVTAAKVEAVLLALRAQE